MATVAIELDYTDETGTPRPESYWVALVTLDMDTNITSVTMRGYYDAAAKSGGAQSFKSEFFQILSPPDREITVGEGLDGVYAYAIAYVAFFSGANPVTA